MSANYRLADERSFGSETGVVSFLAHLKKRPFHIWVLSMVLLCFALAKVGTVGARSIGLLPNVISVDLPSERLMLFAGLAEFIAVLAMLRFLSVKRSCQLVVLFGITFLLYRLTMNSTRCPCMGAAPDLIPWLKLNQDIVLLTVPCGLIALGMWGWAREINRGIATTRRHST